MRLDRRSALLSVAGLAAAWPLGAALADVTANEMVALWPGAPPGGPGPIGVERISARGAVSNIAIPHLEVFAPAQPGGAAMLVAAGGGYRRIEMDSEARPAARWLADQGVTAFVLTYRLPREGWSNGPLAPLQDARRALRLIRSQATARRLDPSRVGVLGFSAGGHLMGLASTNAHAAETRAGDTVDAFSARPDCAALIYPVITLEPPYDHTSTRRALVGDHPSPEASAEWSVETHVTGETPAMFLAQAADDPISNPQNTVIMADACARAGVPVEHHPIASGGHGFGMGHPGTPTAAWPGWYASWLRDRRFLA